MPLLTGTSIHCRLFHLLNYRQLYVFLQDSAIVKYEYSVQKNDLVRLIECNTERSSPYNCMKPIQHPSSTSCSRGKLAHVLFTVP